MVKQCRARLSTTFHHTPLLCSGPCLDIYQRVQTTYEGNVNTSSVVLKRKTLRLKLQHSVNTIGVKNLEDRERHGIVCIRLFVIQFQLYKLIC